MSNRVEYIDQSKGFAILMLLLSHVTPGDDINTWIFTFHMPIFFMIGGLLLWYRHGDNAINGIDVKCLLRKRAKNLLLPYLVFCLLLSIFYAAMSYMAGGQIQYNYFVDTFTFQGVDSMWFIPCYFWAELLMCLILMNDRKIVYVLIGLACVLSIVAMSVVIPDLKFVRYLAKIAISLAFVAIGYLIGKTNIVDKMPLVVAIILIIVCSILGLMGGFSAIGALEFPYYGLYLLLAACMSLSIMVVFNNLKPSNLLSIFGKYSIVVLCTNNLIIEIIRLLDFKLTGAFMLSHGLYGALIFFVIMAVIEYLVIKLAQGPLGVVFGKK